ncbi:MAG: hypothetical protein H0X17_18515, partial [Deltaproteobacteria bacterium]|nr:hypothetical protein [Deltaproteobacteria bacterium]
MGDQSCPVCERRAPAGVSRCDCGYDFAAASATVAIERLRDRRIGARKQRLGGMLLFLPLLTAPPLLIGGSLLVWLTLLPAVLLFTTLGIIRLRKGPD